MEKKEKDKKREWDKEGGREKKDGESSREATLEMCACELKEGDSPLRIAQH